MNIKILSSLENLPENRENVLIIGTHNGIFHIDEVVACAILCLRHPYMTFWILRTRDAAMLAKCDICVDIGGGRYDHHQRGFSKTRKNGVKYASAGLVWASNGYILLTLILAKYFSKFKCNIDSIFQTFDASVIALVDCEDNGIDVEKHCFSFISSFLPLWFHTDFDHQFLEVLKTAITVLEQELKTAIAKDISKNIVTENWNNADCFHHGILEIPAQTLYWRDPIIQLNASTKNREKQINFVIFPYPDGGWAAQCVPPSWENKFGQRIPFPAEWAGQTDKLAEISGVDGATLCQNGLFLPEQIAKKQSFKCVNWQQRLRKDFWLKYLTFSKKIEIRILEPSITKDA